MKKLIVIITLVAAVGVTASPARSFCFEEAGAAYGINPVILWAIAKVESNFNPSAINKNKNGSYDYGLMQINTFWYKHIGQERWDALGDACHNVHIGAWVLAGCIASHGYTWEAIGCYNAVSKDKRMRYAAKIRKVIEDAGYYQQKPHLSASKPPKLLITDSCAGRKCRQ